MMIIVWQTEVLYRKGILILIEKDRIKRRKEGDTQILT